MSRRVPTGVLVSGGGTNLQALIDAAQDPAYPAEIRLVISNKPGVFALERAAKAGIETRVIEHGSFADRPAFEVVIDQALREAGCEIICLAGFMRILTAGFVEAWPNAMLNIHPSLLPSFPGLHTHERALEAGCRVAGCTVHLVSPELDAGPILAQAAVPVLAGDDADTLAARVLEQEHKIYAQALAWLAAGRVAVKDGLAVVDAAPTPDAPSLVNPSGL